MYDDLDNQIREALGMEVPQQHLARLEHFWADQLRDEARRRLGWRMAALAASFLIAAGATISFWLASANDAQNIVADHGSTPRPKSVADVDARGPEPSLSVGRPPTAYERIVFETRRRAPLASEGRASFAALDELVEAMVRDPSASVEAQLTSSKLAASDAERLIMRRLPRMNDAKKRAALRLLAACGSSRSIPVLLQLAREEQWRDVSLATLERIGGVENLASYVDQTSDRMIRAGLLRRLLTSGSDVALRRYLSLVGRDGVRAEALAAADDVPRPPSDAFLDLLDDEDKSVRLSAAVVLGHLNGPDISRALIRRVTENPAEPTEAWIALLACRSDSAKEFLAFASRQPRMLGYMNGARAWWSLALN